MADKLLIIMAVGDPRSSAECCAPLFQATVAAAMEYDVEIIFTGRTSELALKGVAEGVQVKSKNTDSKSMYDVIREAHDAGVVFKVCSSALVNGELELIPEIEDTVGGAYVVSETMNEGTITLTY